MTVKLEKYTFAAAILAGGNARRLGGIAKGNIEVSNGVSIIERLINELARAGINNIVIAANDFEPYQNYGVKVIADIRVDLGPIGGIESVLAHFAGQSDAVMFVPCDMPNITAKEILALKKGFIETESPIVFAETAGFFWHPLCTVVHNDLKEQVSSAIDRGQRKIRDVWRQLKAVSVQFPDETAFININNSTELKSWRKGAKMKKQICAELSITKQLQEFLDSEKIDVETVTGQQGDIEVAKCDDRKESNLDIIYSGGWIACEVARSLGKKMNISLGQTGKLLSHLDVKIRSCSLGCFK